MKAVSRPPADPDLRALVIRIWRVQQEGQRRIVQHGPPVSGYLDESFDERVNARHLRNSLSLPEIAVVHRSAAVREKGLALVRSGDLQGGADLLRKARAFFTQATLCEEGVAFLESFQLAAEAYLQYKERQYDATRVALRGAIQACHVLRDEYGYCVEARRIHLARNIIRVETYANRQVEAMQLASRLVRYIDGRGEPWPIPDLRLVTAPDPLRAKARWILMDQILGELALLTRRHKPRAPDLIPLGSALFQEGATDDNFAPVHTWLAAMRASADGDAAAFLKHARVFFSEAPAYLAQAWRELSLEFLDVVKEIAPEIVATLPGPEERPHGIPR
jgi:hypothetical protein